MDLNLSPKRGNSRPGEASLAQARFLQPRQLENITFPRPGEPIPRSGETTLAQASEFSLRRESFRIAHDLTLPVEPSSPRRANSRSGETTLAQASQPSLRRESFSIAQDFTLPEIRFSHSSTSFTVSLNRILSFSQSDLSQCFLYSKNNVINSEPWLINHVDFNRIFIVGDSAGGNIVHIIAMRAGFQPLNGGLQILGAIYAHPYFFSSKPIGILFIYKGNGRVTTPTLLKRTEEITKIEKKHADEMKLLNDKVLEMEAKHKQEMSSIEQKFQILIKNVLNQNNSGVDVEELATMLSTSGTSTSTHVPNNDKQNHLEDNLPHTV
ncbi:hypothetical protein Lal_00008076 [Lupinus albus]|nr:hypothetical protein Lal_00008076 [Lupinus albus]